MASEILIPLIIFSSLFAVFYVYLNTRNKERMALIEKGADASLFATKKRNFRNITLKIGMLAIGVGIGILMGSLLDNYTTLEEEVCYFSMIFLFAGAFLTANAILEKKEQEKES